MKFVVRDDLIDPITYSIAEIKYKGILEHIYNAGHYCLLEQIKSLTNGRNIVKALEENNLIAIRTFNNKSKYVALTQTAMKYLLLRDSETDYSDMPKNEINITRVNNAPSDKVLFSSFLRFELITLGRFTSKAKLIENFKREYLKSLGFSFSKYEELKDSEKKTSKSIDELNDFYLKFKDVRDSIKTEQGNDIDDAIRHKVELLKSDYSNIQEKLIEQTKIIESAMEILNYVEVCYDNSKLLVSYDSEKFGLNIIILDTGNQMSPWEYMRYPKSFVEKGLIVREVNFDIVSYSQNRSESLLKNFCDNLDAKDKANEKMLEWEKSKGITRHFRKTWTVTPSKSDRKYEPPAVYLKNEGFWNRFRLINNVSVLTETYYLEKHRNFAIGEDDSVIKQKDKESIERLEKLFRNS